LSGFRLGERIRRGGRASRRTAGEFGDVDGGFAVDVLEGGALAVAILAALILLTVLFPFVVVGELVVTILLALLGIAGRMLFRGRGLSRP
jgi:hypothetical protein